MPLLPFRAFVSVEVKESIEVQITKDYSSINKVEEELVDWHHLNQSNRPDLNYDCKQAL